MTANRILRLNNAMQFSQCQIVHKQQSSYLLISTEYFLGMLITQ
jgi:hypothetical protein